MKKLITFALIAFASLLRLSAQISEVEEIIRSGNYGYLHDSSIVRNYNDTLNVLMQYGHFENEAPLNMLVKSCSFMIQNTNTGAITHIVNLPKGYQVNDFRFVTLRRMDGVTTEDFCCFCGTRTQYEGTIALPNPGTGPTLYEDIFSNHGFAGFFSMAEALSPTTSNTAKIRDVENTKELYRMTCYAEYEGHYYQNQHAFKDNAVLDIIGLDDTVNAPSCFCRAKFYPDYPVEGVHWDNNLRYNQTEILTDITKTGNYVVTVSHNINEDSLWTRHSGKEYHLFPGGLELHNYVNSIDFGMAYIDLSCKESDVIKNFKRLDKAKICCVENNEIAIAFRMAAMGYGGLVACRYDYTDGFMHLLKGAYFHCIPELKEVLHMPLNDALAFLFKQNYDYVTTIKWNIDTNYCNYPIKQFYQNNANAQSISLQKRNGFEHLLWCGRETSYPNHPMRLMSQRGELGGGYNLSCHNVNNLWAQPIEIKHTTVYKRMPIRIRYPYNQEKYPVIYVAFAPYEIEKDFICLKDQIQ